MATRKEPVTRNVLRGRFLRVLVVFVIATVLCFCYIKATKRPTPSFERAANNMVSHDQPDPDRDPDPDLTPETFREDMERCSLAMGVSNSTLQNDREAVAAVSQRASKFATWIGSVIPGTFSPDLRNPCWYTPDADWISNHTAVEKKQSGHGALNRAKNYFNQENTTQLCMPFFFIAGFPKCGTTMLHTVMARHPDVYAPQGKEAHWWSYSNMENRTQWLAAYLKFFRTRKGELSKDIITYDASPDMLWSSRFFSAVTKQDYCAMPAVVKSILPEAKFIVLLRNPVSAAYSSFMYAVSLSPDLPRQFHARVTEYIGRLSSCLQKSSLFECSKLTQSKEGQWNIVRLSIELYHVHLKKWLQFYDREQFLFLRTEDMFTDPGAVMEKITSFLGIRTLTEDQVKILFDRKRNVNSAAHTKAYEMLPETRQLLQNLYRSHNEKLAELLNDDTFLWQD